MCHAFKGIKMPSNKNYYKKWRQENPDYYKKWWKKNSGYFKQWRKGNTKYHKERYKKNLKWRKKHLNYHREWIKKNPEKCKVMRHKSNAKRRHNFGWIKMFDNPFDALEKVDWHHITDVYVVAMPKDLHQLYGGKQHREKTMEIVKQIYLKSN